MLSTVTKIKQKYDKDKWWSLNWISKGELVWLPPSTPGKTLYGINLSQDDNVLCLLASSSMDQKHTINELSYPIKHGKFKYEIQPVYYKQPQARHWINRELKQELASGEGPIICDQLPASLPAGFVRDINDPRQLKRLFSKTDHVTDREILNWIPLFWK
jgi:hypothetical protein